MCWRGWGQPVVSASWSSRQTNVIAGVVNAATLVLHATLIRNNDNNLDDEKVTTYVAASSSSVAQR
jgi:hypothetical protein